MGDIPEEASSSQEDSRPRNPTPEHQEVTNQARITSAIHHTNDRILTEPRHPENTGDKAAQIIQDLCLRVQELEGKLTTKNRRHNEHGSHATSRSRSRHGRSPTRRHDTRNGRSTSRDHRREKSPERRYSKRHNRNASRDLSHQRDSDEERRHRDTKRTRNDHIIMGATPFTERILRAKLPKGFDKPTSSSP
ncbi:splicing regulatory glutamine/lysine-rich protein 1-like [Arachis ipaensis]|uniref:splicing regulatory glutamine/lysine-rich protein 1-like n=1 Tax=Arachis ipaensis TaxID=130454 RepID=UPI0007AF939A|nr:splicing regulatory glutamine/lysine-rich protein 1-like [Arachis ipaensis]